MEVSRNSKTVGATATSTVATNLAQFCLELDPAEAQRVLAWVNSICFVFLVIGVLGLKPAAPIIHRTPPAALEAAPTVIEPLVTPVQTVTASATPEEAPSEKPADNASPAVMVTLDSPAVAFSVPTIGNVLVPLTMAQAPPLRPMQSAVPLSAPPLKQTAVAGNGDSRPAPRVEQIGVTGIGGGRPAPPYPEQSLRNQEEGRVVLHIDVDESGKITSVTVKSSSGYPQLDRATADYVRRHWFFAPATGPRQYEAPINFHLNPN